MAYCEKEMNLAGWEFRLCGRKAPVGDYCKQHASAAKEKRRETHNVERITATYNLQAGAWCRKRGMTLADLA